MTWQVAPSDTSLKVIFNNHHVTFSAPDWGGVVDVLFIVTDPAGASDTLTVKVTVNWPASVDALKNQLPEMFCLRQNYPNPFNPRTKMMFGLPRTSDVLIEVFNLKGEKVEILFQGRKPAGYHALVWEASTLSAGSYFVRMQAGKFIQVKKCLLLK